MSKKNMTSNSGKLKQEKNSDSNEDSQPVVGGELHQIAGGEHPALTTNQASCFPIIKTRLEPIHEVLRF